MKMKMFMTATLLTLIMCGSAMAQTTFEAKGSAVVPGVLTLSGNSTTRFMDFLYISNISGNDVDCRVLVYDHDGNDVSALCDIVTGNNSGISDVTLAPNTNEFTLPAGATRSIRIWDSNMNKVIYGHAVIEWDSSNTKMRTALIATGDRVMDNVGQRSSTIMPINGGLPF